MNPTEALERAMVTIVEDGLYIFVDEGTAPQSPIHCYQMELVPPLPSCATICIQADEQAAAALASDMLGVEIEDLVPTDHGDAVAEVLNMVAGRFAIELNGATHAIDLLPPVTTAANDSPHCSYQVGDGALSLWCAA
ncbi:MAG: chemotaxis protein CheX [Myxococcota bacterium]